MAQITLADVTKRYDDGFEAVKHLNLEIADGEFLVLVGPSGCGKSTALRMIAGLEDISEGELAIGGERMNELEPAERDIAMVFQNYALYPHMTVYDNLAFALRRRKAPKDEIDARVRRAAASIELEPLLDRKPRQLSGGQQQRVALGRALVRDPQVFLMDEPLSNLDAKLRVQTRGEISRLQRDLATTTIYVTHDQVEAMTMGDRVAVMRKGELQQVAPPQGLYDRPVNLFVGGFTGRTGAYRSCSRTTRAWRSTPPASTRTPRSPPTRGGRWSSGSGRSRSRRRASRATRPPHAASTGGSSCGRRSARS